MSRTGAKITGVARFYKDVGVKTVEQDGQELHAVTLDGKTVKTGSRTPVHLPNKALAFAVAHEWDAQATDIRPTTMPLMSLASTALDLGKTSSKKELVDEMMHYFHTDTVCYQVTADQMEKLAALQTKKWTPLRQWFAKTFDGDVDVSHGTISGLSHSEQIVQNVRSHLEQVRASCQRIAMARSSRPLTPIVALSVIPAERLRACVAASCDQGVQGATNAST